MEHTIKFDNTSKYTLRKDIGIFASTKDKGFIQQRQYFGQWTNDKSKGKGMEWTLWILGAQ